jgi:hemerythrin superfamily protein
MGLEATMATTKKTKTKRSAERAAARTAKRDVRPQDAIGLLEADHREVDAMFDQYESLKSNAEKLTLASQICVALKVHTQIEEELFYPMAREATGDTDLLDEATVEHMAAKNLIAEIEAMRPGQPLYDAKVKVLGEQVRHHVKEEEEELFPEVRETRVDLDALGAKLAARKAELRALLTPVPAGQPA